MWAGIRRHRLILPCWWRAAAAVILPSISALKVYLPLMCYTQSLGSQHMMLPSLVRTQEKMHPSHTQRHRNFTTPLAAPVYHSQPPYGVKAERKALSWRGTQAEGYWFSLLKHCLFPGSLVANLVLTYAWSIKEEEGSMQVIKMNYQITARNPFWCVFVASLEMLDMLRSLISSEIHDP